MLKFIRKNKIILAWFACIAIVIVFVANSVQVAPFYAFNGAVWLKNGFHYMPTSDINQRTQQDIASQENAVAEKIKTSTPACDSANNGFCQQIAGIYSYKTMTKQAVEYKAAVPDTEELTGYCTLCNDGTFSPSCAVGRGACSWHGGVAAYNVASYRITPGSPEVKAEPAQYSYEPKQQQDSPNYVQPSTPTLSSIVGY